MYKQFTSQRQWFFKQSFLTGCDFFARLAVSCCESYISFVNTLDDSQGFKLIRYRSQTAVWSNSKFNWLNEIVSCELYKSLGVHDEKLAPKCKNLLQETRIKALKQAKNPRKRHFLVLIGRISVNSSIYSRLSIKVSESLAHLSMDMI